MKRPAGVVFAAILMVLLSLLQLLGAAFFALGTVVNISQARSGRMPQYGAGHPSLQFTVVFGILVCCVFVGLAAWGIATSIGLFRMKPWARYSTLIIGGLMAFFGAVAFLTCAAVMFAAGKVPIPAENAQATRAVLVVMFAFGLFLYGLIAVIGVWWLAYFNLRGTREAFGAVSDGKVVAGRRPLLISVLAVFSLIGAAELLVCAFTLKYAFVIAWPVYGVAKAVYDLTFAAVEAACGIGLWKLKRWAWWLEVTLMAFGVCLTFTYALAPSTMARMPSLVSHWNAGADQAFSMVAVLRFAFFMGGMVNAALIAVLIYYRRAFTPAAPPPQDAAPLESVGALPGLPSESESVLEQNTETEHSAGPE